MGAATAKATRFRASSVEDALTRLTEREGSEAPKLELVVDAGEDDGSNPDVHLVFAKEEFLSLMQGSKTGKTNGVTCAINGAFPFVTPKGDVMDIKIQNNGFWVKLLVSRG